MSRATILLISVAALAGCGGGSKSEPPPADDAGMAFDSGTGGECTVNADCVDSPAAQAIKDVRCAGRDIYCLDATCHAECTDTCEAIRTDVNPCAAPRLCVPFLGGATSFCSITPVKCSKVSDCPAYLPPTPNGDPGAWSCTDGVCAYPGFDYATH
jgi:hypothetical protein